MRHRLNILMKRVLYFEVFRVEFKHGKFDYFLKADFNNKEIKNNILKEKNFLYLIVFIHKNI